MAPSTRFVSIGARLVAATTLLFTVVAFLVYMGLTRYERANLLHAKDTAAEMVVSLFAATSQAPVVFEDGTAVNEAIERLALNREVTYAAVYAASKDAPDQIGETLGAFEHGNVPQREDVLSIPANVRMRRAADHVVVVARIPDAAGGKSVGAVCVIFSLERENEAIATMEREILRDSFGIAFLTAALLVLFARRSIVRPIRRLAHAAKQLERGEKVVIDVESADEIGVLASGFRAMTDAIAQREARISARNVDMRLVLDNLEQGIVTLHRDGTMSEERSATMDQWFGPPVAGTPVWTYLGAIDATFGESLRVAWDALTDGFMPLEVCLHQMPRFLRKNDRTYQLAYRPVPVGGEWTKIVLVLSDITDRLEAERADEQQKETLAMFQRILRDPKGFAGFYDECSQLIATTKDPAASLVIVKRALHTLKGICGLFGVGSVARVCHVIETRIEESASHPSPDEEQALTRAWGAVEKTYETLGRVGRGHITLEASEYEALLDMVVKGTDSKTLAAKVASLRSESVTLSFERFADRVRAMATKLGKADLDVVIERTGLRLPPNRFAPFWSAFSHVVRNAVDHGIETTDERLASGKPARATLRMNAQATPDAVSLIVEDDGRGIDWPSVAAKARTMNLPATTREDLVGALCHDEFSTRDVVTETSGRGIGLSVVDAVVRALGGRVEIESTRGRGALFRFVFPPSCIEEARARG